MSGLLEPLQAGAFRLANRIVMAPLTRCRSSPGRVPNTMMAEYYRQRASAGLILSEATSISAQGVGYPDTPGLWSEAQIDGWKAVTRAVHEAGGTILAQLWHVGRVSDPHYLDGQQPVAPSPIAHPGHVSLLRPQKPYDIPRALELGEIPGIIDDYRKAAENAKIAGFDGVEIHGANGYLPHQFLNDQSNHRTDIYGGSIENRARFMLEAVDAAIDVWGADRVGLHLSPITGDDSNLAETYGYVAAQIQERGLAFVFVREPADASPRIGLEIRRRFRGAYIANQQLTREQAENLIARGEADAASWGRDFIANPDLVRRFSLNASLNTPDPATFYGGNEHGYLDYPALA